MNQFKHYVFKLDKNIKCRHLSYVFSFVSDTYVTFYSKVQIITLQITYMFKNTTHLFYIDNGKAQTVEVLVKATFKNVQMSN